MDERKLTSRDFFIGMISALRLRGITCLPPQNDKMDRAFAELFNNELAEEALSNNLDLGFRIIPVRGSSETVYQGIYYLMQLGILTKDFPWGDIRLKITKEHAEYLVNRLPGTPDMYKRLAESFLRHYQGT